MPDVPKFFPTFVVQAVEIDWCWSGQSLQHVCKV
jgi:hypothetical protein